MTAQYILKSVYTIYIKKKFPPVSTLPPEDSHSFFLSGVGKRDLRMIPKFSLFFLFLFVLSFSITVVLIFTALPSSVQPTPTPTSQSPRPVVHIHGSFTHVFFTDPFPLFPLSSSSPLPSSSCSAESIHYWRVILIIVKHPKCVLLKK